MYGQLGKLEGDELLLCLFFRGEGQTVNKVDARDFERRLYLKPLPEGGISFFRAKTTDYKFIVTQVGRTPSLNRGIASITVEEVQRLGFQICGNLESNDRHVCLHCQACICQERNCEPLGSTCSFVSPESPTAENDRMRRQLADAMTVIIEARKNKADLLAIFGKDVTGTVAEKNSQYAYRFEVEVRKPGTESSIR